MNLKTYQLSLANTLLCKSETFENSAYIQSISDSERLTVVKEIIYFWRAQQLERYCYLTSNWLKQQNSFDETILNFVKEINFSPFIEELGKQFLHYVTSLNNPISAALARTELALHQTYHNADLIVPVDWPCDPQPIIDNIMNKGNDLNLRLLKPYKLYVSRKFVDGYISERLDTAV